MNDLDPCGLAKRVAKLLSRKFDARYLIKVKEYENNGEIIPVPQQLIQSDIRGIGEALFENLEMIEGSNTPEDVPEIKINKTGYKKAAFFMDGNYPQHNVQWGSEFIGHYADFRGPIFSVANMQDEITQDSYYSTPLEFYTQDAGSGSRLDYTPEWWRYVPTLSDLLRGFELVPFLFDATSMEDFDFDVHHERFMYYPAYQKTLPYHARYGRLLHTEQKTHIYGSSEHWLCSAEGGLSYGRNATVAPLQISTGTAIWPEGSMALWCGSSAKIVGTPQYRHHVLSAVQISGGIRQNEDDEQITEAVLTVMTKQAPAMIPQFEKVAVVSVDSSVIGDYKDHTPKHLNKVLIKNLDNIPIPSGLLTERTITREGDDYYLTFTMSIPFKNVNDKVIISEKRFKLSSELSGKLLDAEIAKIEAEASTAPTESG